MFTILECAGVDLPPGQRESARVVYAANKAGVLIQFQKVGKKVKNEGRKPTTGAAYPL